jgi:hypothetical protein
MRNVTTMTPAETTHPAAKNVSKPRFMRMPRAYARGPATAFSRGSYCLLLPAEYSRSLPHPG